MIYLVEIYKKIFLFTVALILRYKKKLFYLPVYF